MTHTPVYTQVSELKGFSVKSCPSMPYPGSVLMCSPDHYDIIDVKNPFMEGKIGTVDKKLARAQWEGVRAAFEAAGKKVEVMAPADGLEEMVFCANPAAIGLSPRMERVCVPSRMRYPSRRREVPHLESWLGRAGYGVKKLKEDSTHFEGMGDCRWHPGKRLLWGGYGFRSDPEVLPEIAKAFEAPLVRLKLVNERFYHLDTCFCPLTPEAVLIYPPAFDPASLELILRMFPIVLAADEREATGLLPCNAAVVDSRVAIMQAGAKAAARHMRAVGLEVVEVDTSEFVKSGGSVFCVSLPFY